eukprot:Partr_v1_DN26493_c1_g2_i1_m24134 putative trafficking protein particle complex
MIYSLYVINKAGGLIYNTDFVSTGDGKNGQGPPRLTSNEYLVFAGTFHGIHAIASKISPLSTADQSSSDCSGIESLDTETFRLVCMQTQTGIKFLLTTDPFHKDSEGCLSHIYTIYADYVMKNPFYTPEMPIRCDLFDQKLTQWHSSLAT